MQASDALWIYIVGYYVLFLGAVLGIWRWQIARRREKPPVEFKLLRGPGESLRRRIAKIEESLPVIMLGTSVMPIITGLAVLKFLIWVTPHMRLAYGLVITGLPMLVAAYFSGRFLMGKLSRARNDTLGYLGERAVGESLEGLLSFGYRVFHDVPAEEGKAKFNVDHVVVGPNGIFAIETKTRRKGRARAGFEAHKVAYDGRQLIWPWAEDSFGLKNAEDRARWLSAWLNRMTALGLAAQPVLVLPGWYVVPKGLGPVTVINHKQLVGAITRNQARVLTEEQIDLIARQLDNVCRDVED